MQVSLSDGDQQMLGGKWGEATRIAMSVVTRMAEVEGASALMDITQAHIDACGLLSEAGLEFAETLAAKGGHVRVPTTLNMGPLGPVGEGRKLDCKKSSTSPLTTWPLPRYSTRRRSRRVSVRGWTCRVS